jgi:predicted O-methyltransferase YrrM
MAARTDVGWRSRVALAAYAGKLALRSPSRAGRALSILGTALTDSRLDHESPIPRATPKLLQAILCYDITLPPFSSFAPGTMDPTGLLHIASIARAIDARYIFEIGTFSGVTALTLAMNSPAATVYTLDLEPGQVPTMALQTTDATHIAEAPARVYTGRPEADRVVQLLGDSATFDFAPYHTGCGLVFIDGAHSSAYVERDTESAFRLVTQQSAIIWDDYWRMSPGVVEYLDSRKDLNLWRLAGTRLVIWLSDDARTHLGLA